MMKSTPRSFAAIKRDQLEWLERAVTRSQHLPDVIKARAAEVVDLNSAFADLVEVTLTREQEAVDRLTADAQEADRRAAAMRESAAEHTLAVHALRNL